jgi:hypothetical protein
MNAVKEGKSKRGKHDDYSVVKYNVCIFLHFDWFLRLKEEHSLGVFGNRVLRKIVGRKKQGTEGNYMYRMIIKGKQKGQLLYMELIVYNIFKPINITTLWVYGY